MTREVVYVQAYLTLNCRRALWKAHFSLEEVVYAPFAFWQVSELSSLSESLASVEDPVASSRVFLYGQVWSVSQYFELRRFPMVALVPAARTSHLEQCSSMGAIEVVVEECA